MPRVFSELDALRFVDGRLSEDRRAAFLHHLAENPDEAERIAVWTRQNETICAAFAGVALEPIPPALRVGTGLHARALPPAGNPVVPESPGAVLRLQARVSGPAPEAERRVPAGAVRPRLSATDLRLPLNAALLAALAGLILYVAHGLLAVAPAPAPALPGATAPAEASLAARAADAFSTYALDPVRPVEFTAIQAGPLATWFRKRMGDAVEPADLGPEGWTLLGGRLVPSVGAPGAFFVYENRVGGRLGLLVTPVPEGTDRPASLEDERGVPVMQWATGRRSFALAAEGSPDWLARNGETLKARISP